MTTVIFDIDGTLANCEHRMHWIRSKPKNWAAFSRAMKDDTPNDDIIGLLKLLYNAGNTIVIATGRNENDRNVTEDWLKNVANIGNQYAKLYMRQSSDFRPDYMVKSDMLDQMYQDGFNPTLVFDDRSGVVEMFRSRGLRVLQVAPGDD